MASRGKKTKSRSSDVVPEGSEDSSGLTPELQWVFCHPKLRAAQESDKKVEVSASDLRGAPNKAAEMLLRQAVREPAKIMAMMTALLLEAAKERGRVQLESHKARMRMESQREAALLKQRLKREEKQAEQGGDDEVREKKTLDELRAIAEAFR